MKVPFVSFKPMEKELDKDIRSAFERVYNRSWYIEGQEDETFEKSFAEYCNVNYCIGVGNGLDALMLALKALNISCDDEVIVPSNTYIATALAVTYVGAKLVFPFYEDNRGKSFKIQHSGDIFAERMYPCCLYAINKANTHLDLFDVSLTKNTQCIAVTGAVDLIDKKVYDELGGLDEDYIYGLEDVDFSLKLHKNGYKTLLASNALLFHHESSTRIKTKDYADNDKHNYNVFWSKWGNYLSKNLLLDKIHDGKFFTQKKLKITIIDENYQDNSDFLSKISKDFNDLGFTVELISDLKNMYIGNSSDILLSLSLDYDLENMVARDDIVRVFISQNGEDNPKGYDIVVSEENKDYDSKYNFVIKDNFVKEFLDNLEDILMKSDGFL